MAQEKKPKNLGFPIGTILFVFFIHVALILPPFSSEEEAQNRFPRWLSSWILDWNDFNNFWFTSFESIGLLAFGSEEAQSRSSICLQWRQPWIYNLNDFPYFWSTSHPDTSYQVSSELAFWFRSAKYIFQMAAMVTILDFQLEQFELFFYL